MSNTEWGFVAEIDDVNYSKFADKHNNVTLDVILAGIGVPLFVWLTVTEAFQAWYLRNDALCLGYFFMIFACFGYLGYANSSKVSKTMEHYKIWKIKSLQSVEASRLYDEFNEYINLCKLELSTTTENVVVGTKKVDMGIWGDMNQNVYGTRTRETPEYKVMEALLTSGISIYEKEIIRRGNEIVPSLVKEWKSGRNSPLLERVMQKMETKKIGQQMEKFHLNEEASAWYKKVGLFEDGKNMSDKMKVKIDQTVVQGDQITKTEIKDSVVSKSNIGPSGEDKFTKLKELKEMLAEGLIDDDEFKQMKKEILGK